MQGTMRIRYFVCMLTAILLLVWQPAIAATEFQYNMDEISSLQKEYRSQLGKKIPKKRVVKKATVKQKKQDTVISKQALHLLLPTAKRQPKPVRKIQALRQEPQVQAKQVIAPPSKNSLFAAASNGDIRAIGQLLSRGANVNAANNERETALHMAAAKGHYSVVIYLINHGANLQARTINNWLPIHHATRFRHANIANYLKQRGSSLHARTSDGLSAIDMAKATGDRRILGLFGVR